MYSTSITTFLLSLLLLGSPSTTNAINPALLNRQAYEPCSKAGFFGNVPTCCSVDIIGAASLGCTPPARNPTSPADFKALCGTKKPKCCFVDPVGGIVNAICPTPVGF